MTGDSSSAGERVDRYRITAVIVIAFMTSVVFYGAVAFLLTNQVRPAVTLDEKMGRPDWILWGYGLVFLLALAVILLRRTWFSGDHLFKIAQERGVSDLPAHFQSRTVILCILAEMAGMAGLGLAVMSQKMEPMWRLGAASLALFVYLFPRRRAWDNTIENCRQAIQET